MKMLSVFTLFLSFSALAQTVVTAPVDHVFVPRGFDNNDNVELVVTGKFPNPCYNLNRVEVDVVGDLVKLNVTSIKKDSPLTSACGPMKVPFTEVVSVGSLQAGDYRIVVNGGTPYELRNEMQVEIASSNSVDEHLYALVDYVELGFTGGLSGDAILVAHSVSPCLKFDRVEYLSNEKDTISVLPVMKKVSSNCPEKKTRIEIPIKFGPDALPHDRVLLFVRSIEGKSVHSIIEKN
jgi:hypothetical protein